MDQGAKAVRARGAPRAWWFPVRWGEVRPAQLTHHAPIRELVELDLLLVIEENMPDADVLLRLLRLVLLFQRS